LKLDHKPGVDLIYELAVNLYPSALQSFREAISNALDEGSRMVEIHSSIKEVVVEDWGEGIKDMDKFTKFGDYGKAKLGGGIIGEKGLGKLSLLRLGKEVQFRTNNGKYDMNIMMTPKDFDYEIGAKGDFLTHEGTQIIIPSPQEVPPIDELSDYMKKCFGLYIANGIDISINGVKLGSRLKIDPKEHLICRLKGGIDVKGNIKSEKKGRGTLDLYVRKVFINSVVVDPSRNFSGWVNCDALTPTTARNDVKENDVYGDMLDHLREYVTKFPKTVEQIGRDEVLLGNELAKLFEGYLKDMGLLPQGKFPFGKGNEPSGGSGRKTKPSTGTEEESNNTSQKEDEYIREHTSPKSKNPIKRSVKAKSGISYLDQDCGNDKDPWFFVPPNIIIRNRTNDLYKFALKNKSSLGPKWLRMVPYLARVGVTLRNDYPKLTRDETNKEIDKAIRYFLSEKDEL
jgi:hypothetical protein